MVVDEPPFQLKTKKKRKKESSSFQFRDKHAEAASKYGGPKFSIQLPFWILIGTKNVCLKTIVNGNKSNKLIFLEKREIWGYAIVRHCYRDSAWLSLTLWLETQLLKSELSLSIACTLAFLFCVPLGGRGCWLSHYYAFQMQLPLNFHGFVIAVVHCWYMFGWILSSFLYLISVIIKNLKPNVYYVVNP